MKLLLEKSIKKDAKKYLKKFLLIQNQRNKRVKKDIYN